MEFGPSLTNVSKGQRGPMWVILDKSSFTGVQLGSQISKSKLEGSCSLRYVCSQRTAGLLKVTKNLPGLIPVTQNEMCESTRLSPKHLQVRG